MTIAPAPMRTATRVVFWMALLGFAAFGVLVSMGLGPGLLIGAGLLATYDLKRHDRIPMSGYGLLVLAMPVVAYLALVLVWRQSG